MAYFLPLLSFNLTSMSSLKLFGLFLSERFKMRRRKGFLPSLDSMEKRDIPAVITYPLAPSIILFDPKGEREPDPGPLNQTPIYDFILDPPLNIINMDTPIDTSSYC